MSTDTGKMALESPSAPFIGKKPSYNLSLSRAASLTCVRRRGLLATFLVVCILYGLYVYTYTQSSGRDHKTHDSTKDRTQEPGHELHGLQDHHCGRPSSDALLLDQPGCRVPAYEPFSAEVQNLVEDFPTVVCADPPPLVRSNQTSLILERSLVTAYNASDVTCCYTGMWRNPGPRWQDNPGRSGPLFDGQRWGNDIQFDKECVPFHESVDVPFEFVRVTCSSENGSRVYMDYHAFVPIKRPRGATSAGVSPSEYTSEDAVNVLIVGIDSVSRLNFIRTMPRTRAYLEQHLGGVNMLGYNKIEDNTFPNLVPFLTSYTIPELKKLCWPEDNTHLDSCPFLWKRFNQQGYVNMFAEDTAWMGLFHYVKRGFVNQPTDYDPRPLLYLGEKDLGRGGGYNAKYCIGQRHQIEVLFDYGRKFVSAMRATSRKFFGLLWGTSLSHDMLNQPDEADAMYEHFLKNISDSGILNRTALIFMSDHGLRFGGILATSQGHQENRMPVMYYVLPEWVRKRYPLAMRNLACNQRSLVTLFDLHVTLHHFMDLKSLEPDKLADAAARVQQAFDSNNQTKAPRGISMFVPIPGTRTCEDAGIPENYCACQRLAVVDPNTDGVRRVVDLVVQHVNQLLAGQAGCAQLTLGEVVRAERGSPPSRVIKEGAQQDEYMVELRTEPGGALLSATVRHHIKSDTIKLAGSISRLNAYGNTSWCANSATLKPLCYCKAAPPGNQQDDLKQTDLPT